MNVADDVPVLSVVLPTYNRRERLEQVLRSLAAQDLDVPFEVVVVSDGSTDGTNEYLRSGSLPCRVVAVLQENQGPSVARNAGVERATSDLIVFIDDDVVASPRLLRSHFDAHARLGERAVVVGPMLDPPDHRMTPWVAWEQRMLAKQYRAMQEGRYAATARQFYTGNASVRREHVRRVGGFDPAFRRAEDVELAFRLETAGLSFHFEPAAAGYHYAERSYDAWRRTAYVYGHNDVVFARDLGHAWIFPFIADSFQSHHRGVRLLAMGATSSRRVRSSLRWMLERLVPTGASSTQRPLVQHALSAIYGIEYHCGVADELGSAAAFRHLVMSPSRRAAELAG